MNSVLLRGRVGGDPRVNQTKNGSKVASFSVATNESYVDKQGQKQQVTDWHNVVVWGNLAEAVGVGVRKGSDVVVLGKMKTRKYQDKSGVEKYTTEINAEGVFTGLNVQRTQQATPPEPSYPDFPDGGQQDDLGIGL
jgi:single-strand DNA-binding protein